MLVLLDEIVFKNTPCNSKRIYAGYSKKGMGLKACIHAGSI